MVIVPGAEKPAKIGSWDDVVKRLRTTIGTTEHAKLDADL